MSARKDAAKMMLALEKMPEADAVRVLQVLAASFDHALVPLTKEAPAGI